MNIIIPVGGIGKRFSDEGYDLPKPLIRTLGEHLIVECIKSIKPLEEDIIYIIYRSDLKKFNFEDIIRNRFSLLNFNFISIDFNTRGASETVLQGLLKMSENELSQLTLVIDSDNLYNDDIIQISKDINSNLIFYHKTDLQKPIYSYLKLNGNIVIDIKEKIKISNDACIGSYCFKNGELLKSSILEILSKSIDGEYYISNVYKHLLNNNVEVLSHRVDNYVCLGTPEQLKSYSSSITTGKKLRVCFDLDNTLVTYPKISGDYTSVDPIDRNISYLKFLSNLGHEIIIYTARRMKTHSGNVGKIQADVGQITFDTLNKFNIPYNEVYFGKPYADFYIDDLAIKSYDDLEKQIGIYNIHPDTRTHNRIEITSNQIKKYSSDISGEKYWYTNIPETISKYFPKLISSSFDSITISKINGIPLSYINTNKTLTKDILYSLLDTLDIIHKSDSSTNSMNIYQNYSKKLKERMSGFDSSKYYKFIEHFSDTLEFLNKYEENNCGSFGVIHGDPVFTNVLMDHHNNFFFIDMRGKLSNDLTIYGDIFYDYAKVYQSIIGYDFILAGEDLDLDYINKNKTLFKQYILDKFSEKEFRNIQMITISLILSLLPIHNNDKCLLFYKLIELV